MFSQEVVITLLLVFFGAGGVGVTWLNNRAKKKPEISMEEAEEKALTIAKPDMEKTYQDYVNKIVDSQNQRIDKFEREIAEYRRRSDAALNYIIKLRDHIVQELPPPPPPWPEDI